MCTTSSVCATINVFAQLVKHSTEMRTIEYSRIVKEATNVREGDKTNRTKFNRVFPDS